MKSEVTFKDYKDSTRGYYTQIMEKELADAGKLAVKRKVLGRISGITNRAFIDGYMPIKFYVHYLKGYTNVYGVFNKIKDGE